MIYADAVRIAEEVREWLVPCCEPDHAWVVGSVRRRRHEVHDIELLGKPLMTPPRPQFGDLRIFGTPVEKMLYEKVQAGALRKGEKDGPKAKQFYLGREYWGLDLLNDFKLELYLVTPPAQWGVGAVIRTGPGNEGDHFSKWCVTNRSNRVSFPQGGGLPDGYKVRHLAVWSVEQLDSKLEPLKGQTPLPMPYEQDFLDFLGLGWVEPDQRHVPRGRR